MQGLGRAAGSPAPATLPQLLRTLRSAAARCRAHSGWPVDIASLAMAARLRCVRRHSVTVTGCVLLCREIANVVLNIAEAAQQSSGGLGRLRGPRRAAKALGGATSPAAGTRARL